MLVRPRDQNQLTKRFQLYIIYEGNHTLYILGDFTSLCLPAKGQMKFFFFLQETQTFPLSEKPETPLIYINCMF